MIETRIPFQTLEVGEYFRPYQSGPLMEKVDSGSAWVHWKNGQRLTNCFPLDMVYRVKNELPT